MYPRSTLFVISNETKQGGILPPYLFARYIRYLLCDISGTHIGCCIGGLTVNIFAYADDIILIAPSWHSLYYETQSRHCHTTV